MIDTLTSLCVLCVLFFIKKTLTKNSNFGNEMFTYSTVVCVPRSKSVYLVKRLHGKRTANFSCASSNVNKKGGCSSAGPPARVTILSSLEKNII